MLYDYPERATPSVCAIAAAARSETRAAPAATGSPQCPIAVFTYLAATGSEATRRDGLCETGAPARLGSARAPIGCRPAPPGAPKRGPRMSQRCSIFGRMTNQPTNHDTTDDSDASQRGAVERFIRTPPAWPDAWLDAAFMPDPSSPANSAARSVTRACVLLGLFGVVELSPARPSQIGWGHATLAATLAVLLGLIVLAARRLTDERSAAAARRVVGACDGRGRCRQIAADTAKLLLPDHEMPPAGRLRTSRRLIVAAAVAAVVAIAVWTPRAGAGVAGFVRSDLTVAEALTLSPLWLLFVPIVLISAAAIEASVQAIAPCGQIGPTGHRCAMAFKHTGGCVSTCPARSQPYTVMRPTPDIFCALPAGHDGDHLYQCGIRAPRRDVPRRQRIRRWCALPVGHPGHCRRVCATRDGRCLGCREPHDHEGPHAAVKAAPSSD